MKLSRRTLLTSAASATAVLGATPLVLANLGDGPCRFLFVHAEGGWDPLCVFAPLFDASEVEMEPDAEPWTASGLSLVDHPERPVTRRFFERHASKVAVLNGVSTRSVNHETCAIVALTGSTSDDRPDWATVLGFENREAFTLPHLVVSGPVFAGPHSVFVSNAQGKLQETIDGTVLLDGDNPLRSPGAPGGRIVDRFLEQRGRALAQGSSDAHRVANYREALGRSRELTDGALEVRLVSGETFAARTQTAVSALAAGLCRCATVSTDFVWDTHDDNTVQSGLFDGLFGDLDALLGSLSGTLGPDGLPLSETTVVVVLSEMARTPAYNGSGGRDHWPFTSMMVMGPGVVGGRTYGSYSSLYTGVGVAADGAPDPARAGISTDAFGATLLSLGGLDPSDHLRTDAVPIPGLIG